jgi:hypothetical protein
MQEGQASANSQVHQEEVQDVPELVRSITHQPA